MRWLFGTCAILTVTLLGACGGLGLEFDQTQAAITNGSTTKGFASVGELVVRTKAGRSHACTATLIGQRTALTAAHCIEDAVDIAFVVGGAAYDADNGGAISHPDYNPRTEDNDVGVVRLLDAPGVDPTPLSTLTPAVGAGVTLVGYGVTADDETDGGVKRKAPNTISAVTRIRLGFTGTGGAIGNMCFGDSGGPTFAEVDGQVVQVGVHSHGTKGELCGVREYDARVDVFVDWIVEVAGGDVLYQGDGAAASSDGKERLLVSGLDRVRADGAGPTLAPRTGCSLANPRDISSPLAYLILLGLGLAMRRYARGRARAARS